MAKVSKASVNYRQQPARLFYTGRVRRCGTCSMFRPKLGGSTGACTLVQGFIRAGDVCDRWEAK